MRMPSTKKTPTIPPIRAIAAKARESAFMERVHPLLSPKGCQLDAQGRSTLCGLLKWSNRRTITKAKGGTGADGEVVVIHDSDLMKIGRVNLAIWDATYPQLQGIDVGSWFAPEFSGERVPKLRQVLELCKGRARVDIELKYYGHDVRLEERVVEIVEASGMESEVVVMSLKYEGIQKLRELRPDWTVGLLTATALGDLTRLDADFLAVHANLATPHFIRRAHRRGKEVFVWTINDPSQMSRMISRGVDSLITDQPALARAVIQERAEMNVVERLLLELSLWLGAESSQPGPETDAG